MILCILCVCACDTCLQILLNGTQKHSQKNLKQQITFVANKYIVWHLIKAYLDIYIKRTVLDSKQNGTMLCCRLICIVFIDQLCDCLLYFGEMPPDGFVYSTRWF